MNSNDQLEPTVFVIFGGAGDLTWRKLVPVLFDLSRDRSLPDDLLIIVVDRVDMSEETLRQCLHIFERRRIHHNTIRPHSSLRGKACHKPAGQPNCSSKSSSILFEQSS